MIETTPTKGAQVSWYCFSSISLLSMIYQCNQYKRLFRVKAAISLCSPETAHGSENLDFRIFRYENAMALRSSDLYKVLLKIQDCCINGVAGPWLNPKNECFTQYVTCVSEGIKPLCKWTVDRCSLCAYLFGYSKLGKLCVWAILSCSSSLQERWECH